eukprot:329562-Amphidinium_carterae.5
MGKKRSRCSSSYTYSYYSDMDEEPDWTEGVEQEVADGNGRPTAESCEPERTEDEVQVSAATATASENRKGEDDSWGRWAANASGQQHGPHPQAGQPSTFLGQNATEQSQWCASAGRQCSAAATTAAISPVAVVQAARVVENTANSSDPELAKKRSRELEVRVYLNKSNVDMFDLGSEEGVVSRIATVAQSMADTKSWMRSVTDIPMRPLWGTLWSLSLRNQFFRAQEVERITDMDKGQLEGDRNVVRDALRLAIKSQMEGRAALAAIWKSMEPGHTKVALKHLWNALLGAAGLPNESYVDRLPPIKAPDSRQRGQKAQRDKDVQAVDSVAKDDAKEHSRKKGDHGVPKDAADVESKRAKMGNYKLDEKASGSGHQNVATAQARARDGGSKKTDDKDRTRHSAKQSHGVKRKNEADSEHARRPYPFRRNDTDSGAKPLGKPPPPVIVDDDSEHDEAHKYQKRLKSMRKKVVGAGKKSDEKIRLTPVPPLPDVAAKIARDGAPVVNTRPWWDTRQDTCGAQGAPWRAGQTVEGEHDVEDDHMHSGGNFEQPKRDEGYWCAGQLVPPPPVPNSTHTPTLQGSSADVSASSGGWIVSRSGLRIPTPPKRCIHIVAELLMFCVGFVPSCATLVCLDSAVTQDLSNVMDCCGDEWVLYVWHVCLRAVAIFVQITKLRGIEPCRTMHLAGHIVGTAGWIHRRHPFSQRGVGHDGTSVHTLQNTHDLAALYGRYNREYLREVEEDAELGLLRPRHILEGEVRRDLHDDLQRTRTVAAPIVPHGGTGMNSETETIEASESGDDYSIAAQHSENIPEVEDIEWDQRLSVIAEVGSCCDTDLDSEEAGEIDWVQNEVEREVTEMLPRNPSPTQVTAQNGDSDQAVCGSSCDEDVSSDEMAELEW